MRISEVVNWKDMGSSAIKSMGKEVRDELLPSGITSIGDDGTTYEWYGRQWVNPQNQRVAKKAIGQELSRREFEKDHVGDVAVRFVNGYEYFYHDIKRSVFDQWMNASSKGSFLNTHIKPNYAYTRTR